MKAMMRMAMIGAITNSKMNPHIGGGSFLHDMMDREGTIALALFTWRDPAHHVDEDYQRD